MGEGLARAEAPPGAGAGAGAGEDEALRREVERLREEVALAEARGLPPPADLGGPEVGVRVLPFSDGGAYEGETVDGLRHGRGEHRCANGDRYEGGWRFDKRHGRGEMVFVSGMRYVGEWIDDQAQGEGECWYPGGQHYVGEWRADHRWGWGRLELPGGDTYEGEWLDDVMHGMGVFAYTDGSRFEGEFVVGERRKGTFISGDGRSEYSGGWRNGLRHGYGTFREEGGMRYRGGWEGDLRHGEGLCEYADGVTYEGPWKRDLMHGPRGTLTQSGGLRYMGEFRANQQQGQGTCTFENGDIYSGEWQDGQRCGQGKCLYATGDEYEGSWIGGLRQGKGRCKFASGDDYRGDWAGNERHGYGVCVFADGTQFRGEWERGAWVQSTADPTATKVFGPGAARATAGAEAVFGIEAFDDEGNRRLSGGDEFLCVLQKASDSPEPPTPAVVEVTPRVNAGGLSVGCDGSAKGTPPASREGADADLDAVWAKVEDGADGTYVVRYTPQDVGTFKLFVLIGDSEPVADSPYTVRVNPGAPEPATCQLLGEGRRRAIRSESSEFLIEFRDQLGHRCAGVIDLPLNISLSNGTGSVPVSCEPVGNGRVRCKYKASRPGFYRLSLSSGGHPVGRSPYSVRVWDSEEAAERGEAKAAVATGGGEPNRAPPDQSAVWEGIARTEFAADGCDDGWDSEPEIQETEEERYIKENPDVPVVEHLEDIWKVGKWQKEAAALDRKEKEKNLRRLRARFEREFGDLSASPLALGAPLPPGLQALAALD